jgi:hypothetical protein
MKPTHSISNKEMAFVHMYAQMANLTEPERRQIMLDETGCWSSKQLDRQSFERLMIALEKVLFWRVEIGQARDPRHCSRCETPMRQLRGGRGLCPACGHSRQIYAWTDNYWASRSTPSGKADRRTIYRLTRMFGLLSDYLPEHQRNDVYLAGIIAQSDRSAAVSYTDSSGKMLWHLVPALAAGRAIEAIKDRLRYALKPVEA